MSDKQKFKLSFWMDYDLYRKIKLLAYEEKTTVTDIINELVLKRIQEKEKK